MFTPKKAKQFSDSAKGCMTISEMFQRQSPSHQSLARNLINDLNQRLSIKKPRNELKETSNSISNGASTSGAPDNFNRNLNQVAKVSDKVNPKKVAKGTKNVSAPPNKNLKSSQTKVDIAKKKPRTIKNTKQKQTQNKGSTKRANVGGKKAKSTKQVTRDIIKKKWILRRKISALTKQFKKINGISNKAKGKPRMLKKDPQKKPWKQVISDAVKRIIIGLSFWFWAYCRRTAFGV